MSLITLSPLGVLRRFVCATYLSDSAQQIESEWRDTNANEKYIISLGTEHFANTGNSQTAQRS